jgi:hypothetical protein
MLGLIVPGNIAPRRSETEEKKVSVKCRGAVLRALHASVPDLQGESLRGHGVDLCARLVVDALASPEVRPGGPGAAIGSDRAPLARPG